MTHRRRPGLTPHGMILDETTEMPETTPTTPDTDPDATRTETTEDTATTEEAVTTEADPRSDYLRYLTGPSTPNPNPNGPRGPRPLSARAYRRAVTQKTKGDRL